MNDSRFLNIIAIVLMCFWLTTKLVNVYNYPLFGAIYELSALLFLIATCLMPIVVLVFLIKAPLVSRNKYLVPLLLSIVVVLVMIFFPFLYTVNHRV